MVEPSSNIEKSPFDAPSSIGELALIVLKGAESLGTLVDKKLVEWYNNDMVSKHNLPFVTTFIKKIDCPRFTSGDGKGLILDSVRGVDLFFLVDVGNYAVEYEFFGKMNSMSPDDHFADLKRIISAVAGKARRMTVVMPLLYGGRQHRRNNRESLDCAQMLQELYTMGVSDVITFDAHDPRVQNATPLMGFDNFFPTYQVLKVLKERFPNIIINKQHFMIVSPDEGAMNRNIYYASVLGVELGMFYKRRDYTVVVEGRNPIVEHKYLGIPVKDKDIFVSDDIIATGDSALHLCKELKRRGARNVFLMATYALFTKGAKIFDDAYKKHFFTAVVSTNLTYVPKEILDRKWFIRADLSKYIANIIGTINQNKSVGDLLSNTDKIRERILRIDKDGTHLPPDKPQDNE